MKMIPVIYMAVKAIFKQNLNRTILSIIGVVIGVAAVITVVSIGRSFERFTIESLTGKNENGIRIIVNFFPENEELYNDTFTFFHHQDVNLVKSIDGIQHVQIKETENEFVNVNFELEQNLKGSADVSKTSKIETNYIGRTINDTDELYSSKVAVVPNDLFNLNLESAAEFINRTISLNEHTFTIIGIYESEEHIISSNSILIPNQTFNKYFNKNNHIQYLEFYMYQTDEISSIINIVQQELMDKGRNRNIGIYDITNTSIVSSNISQLFSVITMVVASIAAISLFIAGVGIMNMMYTIVSERKKEIGIKRALGATKKQIMQQFFLEGIFISILGGSIGLLSGWVLSEILSIWFPFQVEFDFFTVVLAIGISSLVGIIFSFVPAKKAANQNTIDIIH